MLLLEPSIYSEKYNSEQSTVTLNKSSACVPPQIVVANAGLSIKGFLFPCKPSKIGFLCISISETGSSAFHSNNKSIIFTSIEFVVPIVTAVG